ncbi:hypothetical protein LJC32_03010 [Oscillospiraceae bacterium OttesenSCG-928-F05]|nr:hypothetical protein [Oscillospiraceae bacterium OttesenSCG-928-F05]
MINRTITHNNGRIYTILDERVPDTLLSYSTEYGTHYVIAWKLNYLENGRCDWEQGHYFMENEQDARRSMVYREHDRQGRTPSRPTREI